METLGIELKSARKKQNISLETISEGTKINARNLRALEDGRYGDLPGGMYNRAFLRTYCDYLGLDPAPFLKRYEAETTPENDKAPKARPKVFRPVNYPQPHPIAVWSLLLVVTISGLYFSRKWITAVFSPYVSRPPAANIETTPLLQAAQQSASVPAGQASTAPNAGGVNASAAETAVAQPQATQAQTPPQAGSVAQSETDGPAKRDAAAQLEPARSGGQSQVNAAATQAPAAPVQPVDQNGSPKLSALLQPGTSNITGPRSIRIQMHVVQECWTSVTSDGKRVFVKMLKPGDDQVFDAESRLTVVLGNAAGVRLTINGKPARPLGKNGEVVKVSIDEESIPNLVEKSVG